MDTTRVETIGRRTFAFGLTWDAHPSKPAWKDVAARRDAVGMPRNRPCYYALCAATDGHYAIGFGVPAAKVKGPLFSYAATLAATAGDGIYIASVAADDTLWYCVVRGGVVAPGTDFIGPADDVLRRVRQFSEMLHFGSDAVFADAGLEIPGGAQPFDPIAAIAKVKKPIRVQRHTQGKPVATLLATVVCGALLAGGYMAYTRHTANQHSKILTAQQRAQRVQSYRGAVTAALAGYPADPAWMQAAWHLLDARLPVFASGYSLKSLTCTQTGCDAVYSTHDPRAPRAIADLIGRFGAGAVSVQSNGKDARVHVPLSGHPVPVTESLLRNPPPAGLDVLNWTGLAPLHVAGLSSPPAYSANNVAQSNGAIALGYPPLLVATATLKGASPLSSALADATQWAAKGGFRLTRFEVKFSPDAGNDPAWTATLVGLHG